MYQGLNARTKCPEGTKKPCSVTIENDVYIVSTPYDPALVAAIKSLPRNERTYDPERRVWLVDPKHGESLANWIEWYIGDKVSLPPLPIAGVSRFTQYFMVRYIGNCKPRSDGESTAFGYVGNKWQLLFPEQVLRTWFDDGLSVPGRNENYFSLLSIKRNASQEDIGAAFRHMAKLWHPDVCKEANAQEIFVRIKMAYDVLKDPDTRARYEAGLALQATLHTQSVVDEQPKSIYRSPLRSGRILVEGTRGLGITVVKNILKWDDIVDDQGHMLVTSWPMGAKEPVEVWI